MRPLKYRRNKSYLLVDGYNVIGQWSRIDKTVPLEDQRRELLDILADYNAETDEDIYVIFDAYLVKKSGGGLHRYKGLTVIFTREFETADHFIERQVAEMGRVRGIRVATSDNIEQQIILSRGGSRLSAREFEAEVDAVSAKRRLRQKQLKKAATLTNGLSIDELQSLKAQVEETD
ncbi:NYN domain-containing protein [Peptoniphilus equinus]|uniref:NYN domain-containing protein n=1 Tax=Peptoniphilus equinus TaxID=3016343 RepID=A0ABY7QT64_9FIRM|nr:NYN domain-containing protein [Peptoniphilus equinus]WBW49531.1 NYN domain-containing protein [Peptoniphilus equinus]